MAVSQPAPRHAGRDDTPEEEWPARIRAGDERAFEAMFLRYYQPLVRFVAPLLSDLEEAQDVVQGVFVRILERRASWEVRGSLKVYLYSSVRNAALSRLRARRVRRRTAPQVLALVAPEGEEGPRRAWADVPQADAELAAALHQAIERLPARARQAFELRFIHQLSYAEVAGVMGITESTVNVHITRALTALRLTLAPFAPVLLFLLLPS